MDENLNKFMKPLSCDALRATRPSRVERILAWIPFLGWSFAAALEEERIRPMILSIERQLLARPDPSDLWGRDPRRRELSLAVRTLIKEEFGWPNDHFIPDDPFGIACWAHRDSLDCVFAAQCIEKQFGFQQSSSKWERLYDHGSVGEFVEMLMTNDKNG